MSRTPILTKSKPDRLLKEDAREAFIIPFHKEVTWLRREEHLSLLMARTA